MVQCSNVETEGWVMWRTEMGNVEDREMGRRLDNDVWTLSADCP